MRNEYSIPFFKLKYLLVKIGRVNSTNLLTLISYINKFVEKRRLIFKNCNNFEKTKNTHIKFDK